MNELANRKSHPYSLQDVIDDLKWNLRGEHLLDFYINFGVRMALAWLEPVLGDHLGAQHSKYTFMSILNQIKDMDMDEKTELEGI